MRSVFASDKTRSKQWRIGQLQALLRMLEQEEDSLCQAMFCDLHKAPLEGYLTELGLVKSECLLALENIDKWMEPKKTSNTALNIPCWSTTQRDPLGVVLIMGAWNYPMQLTLAPLVGAIAAGNCVVIKPGSFAVESSHALAKAITKHLDNDCIRVIEGNRDIANALLKEVFEQTCFTGSAFVGRMVAEAAARNLRPCMLELGGKSPTIVDKTADLEHAVQRIIWGTFINSGQTCIRPDFVLVHQDVAEKFFILCKKYVMEFYSSTPQRSEWYGRIINDAAFARIEKLLAKSKATVVTGGQSDSVDRYIAPTVLDFGHDLARFRETDIMQDEIFGPVLPCCRYATTESAIQLIRDLPTGKPLALYCFSTNQKLIQEVKLRTSSGALVINDCLMHAANHDLPFGGVGNSGMGAYHGERSFNAFSHEKAVLEKSPALDQSIFLKFLLSARFPPYTPLKAKLVSVFSLHWISHAVNYPAPVFRTAAKLATAYVALRLLGFNIVHSDFKLLNHIKTFVSNINLST